MAARCPICGAEAPPASGNPHRPFCSSRCRMIDLDRWLRGDYRIPGEPVDPADVHPTEDPPGSSQIDGS